MASNPPFLREASRQCVVQRRRPYGNPGSSRTRFRDRPETVRLHRGIGVHLHPGILFAFIPEQRSESSRNRVHVPPDSPRFPDARAIATPKTVTAMQTSFSPPVEQLARRLFP